MAKFIRFDNFLIPIESIISVIINETKIILSWKSKINDHIELEENLFDEEEANERFEEILEQLND